jgi:hypothetical protein
MIGNPTLGDAILDRIVHNAYRIELSGDSLRKHKAEVEPGSHEMSTIDLSASGPGRHRVGTMAGFRLELVADFVRIHT